MPGVGRSWRTPAKHDLMNKVIGVEVGAVGYKPDVSRCVWLDLTAGDGVVPDGSEWERNCSPGLLAYHATNSRKPVGITLYENKPATFDRLVSALDANLPRLCYRQVDDATWQHEKSDVLIVALNEDGATAPLRNVDRDTAVLVSNDPNAIIDWAMRDTFAQEVGERTPWFRSISTMGCNVGGLKRLAYGERAKWFSLVERQETALPRHRDLFIAAIENDDSQWAYLLGEPDKWRDKVTTNVVKSFNKHQMRVDTAWFRGDRRHYEQIKRRLFLTRGELAAS